MAPVVKRQKMAVTRSATASKIRGIAAFTNVSKGSSITKSVIDKNINVESIAIAPTQPEKQVLLTRKRKVDEVEEESAHLVSQILSSASRNIRPLPRKNSTKSVPQTPRKPISSGITPDSFQTPTKGATSLLNRLFLAPETPTRSPLNTKPSTAPLFQETSQDLPAELIDLLNLQAAFLTALSLHYAHEGTHSPADLRMLCPDVARAWGKRSVTLEDLRRTIGVLNTNILERNKDSRIPRLSISDYGSGKICIEIQIEASKPGRFARPIDEDYMNEIFVRGIKTLWENRSSADIEAKEFIRTLPQEPIKTCSSLLKMTPLLAKGQRRLEDLKAGIIIMKEQEKAKEVKVTYATGAKPTLLERLRAKQLQRANMPLPPTKEQLARKAAIQRIEEVAAVLSLLSTSSSIGQQRVSFTLPTVLGKLKDSFKTPMSKAEGETCLRLLASDIAPVWVKIVKMGKSEALVVNRDGKPTESFLLEQIRKCS